MKAHLEKVPLCADSSFLVREFNVPYFEAPLHFHPVFELTLICESSGKRFIGDHVEDFCVGDLVFMGPDLPHLYRCDDEYYQNNPLVRAKAIIIQFDANFLGKDFFSIPEMKRVTQLFSNSMRGMSFYGATSAEITTCMNKIKQAEGVERLIQLLHILNTLSKSEEYHLLSRHNIVGHNPKDTARMNRIYEYVFENYMGAISLQDIASHAHMSEAAFCRYFKKNTRKTFTTFINELRISKATKLLVEDELNVCQICYKCGFENLSNFNRQFKMVTGYSPLQYKHHFKDHLPVDTEYLLL